jgi:hypothetical protein
MVKAIEKFLDLHRWNLGLKPPKKLSCWCKKKLLPAWALGHYSVFINVIYNLRRLGPLLQLLGFHEIHAVATS